MKKTPLESGVKWVSSKNSRKFNTRFSPPLQARRILKALPPWRTVGAIAALVVSRKLPDELIEACNG